jgi:hypothetical protein
MGKRFIGFVGVLCFALPMGGSAGAGTVPQAHSPKFVGVYRVSVTAGANTDRAKWTFSADGKVDQDPRATWSNSGNTITVNGFVGDNEIVLVGTKSGKGINSKRNPGHWYYADTPLGTWWAVKIS